MNDIEKLSALIDRISGIKEIGFGNGYPEYPAKIEEIIFVCGGSDIDYLSHTDPIKAKDISELNEKEIASYMTFITRGKRFCTGHIASYTEDGTILALAKRLLEIQNKKNYKEKRPHTRK